MTRYVQAFTSQGAEVVDVVIPELFERRSLRSALRRTPEFALTARLYDERGVVVTNVPALAEEPAAAAGPVRTHALVLVTEVDDAAAGAVAFALALGAADVRAVHVALDPEAAQRVRSDWSGRAMPIPLQIIDAPFRSLQEPVLEAVRGVTSRPGAIAAVVVPAVATGSWWRDLWHNERSLYLGWLLRFEPRVVVSTVPLHRRLS